MSCLRLQIYLRHPVGGQVENSVSVRVSDRRSRKEECVSNCVGADGVLWSVLSISAIRFLCYIKMKEREPMSIREFREETVL